MDISFPTFRKYVEKRLHTEARIPDDHNQVFYHGSSNAVLRGDNYRLLPPAVTSVISEKGRKQNLGRVFFTKDLNSAKIYAGRAVQQFGGQPVVYRVIPMGDIETLNTTPGTSVYHAPWAFYDSNNLYK